MKQFIRALVKESSAFKHLQDFFPKLSAAKAEAGIYLYWSGNKKGHGVQGVSPKILTRAERTAWDSFVAMVLDFFGNHKAKNYVDLIETLVIN